MLTVDEPSAVYHLHETFNILENNLPRPGYYALRGLLWFA